MTDAIKVLIVDDNTQYRQAFARNLVLNDMQAIQAEDAEQAMGLLRAQAPDVMVTDLQMRTATEGLDLIREALAQEPCLPVIMISAVGSFDEGAMASKLGAVHVLSKAKIDEEMSVFYDCVRTAHGDYRKARKALKEISDLRAATLNGDVTTDDALHALRTLTEDASLHDYVRTEAFDLITSLTDSQQSGSSQMEAAQAMAAADSHELETVDETLKKTVGGLDALAPDTRESLRIAEYLFQQSARLGSHLELARTTCFSYCFSVENQAKFSLRKRLQRFLSEKGSMDLVRGLLDKPSGHVNMFFQQYVLQAMRQHRMDFSIDNVRQTFLRILEHQTKYRPDGLKALGIIILTFGRNYTYRQFNKSNVIENPLGIRGLEGDEEVLRLAVLLVSLQHLRNPYIHPEIRGREGIEMIRDTAIQCLNLLSRLR